MLNNLLKPKSNQHLNPRLSHMIMCLRLNSIIAVTFYQFESFQFLLNLGPTIMYLRLFSLEIVKESIKSLRRNQFIS